MLVTVHVQQICVGNVTRISVQYERVNQTVTCTSSGGPATDVTWNKDDAQISLVSNEGPGVVYEYLQIIY